MTVTELIEKLKKVSDQNALVVDVNGLPLEEVIDDYDRAVIE